MCGTVGFAQTRSSLTNLDFELKRDSGLPSFFYVNEKDIKDGRYKVSVDSIEKFVEKGLYGSITLNCTSMAKDISQEMPAARTTDDDIVINLLK